MKEKVPEINSEILSVPISQEEYDKKHTRKLTETQIPVLDYFQSRADELNAQLEGLQTELHVFLNRCAKELKIPADWQPLSLIKKKFVNPNAPPVEEEVIENADDT